MMKFLIAFLMFAMAGAASANSCVELKSLPTDLHVSQICHKGYTSLYSDELKQPLVVGYELTGDTTKFCLPRESGFHVDDIHPTVSPKNYAGSNEDIGHLKDAKDGAGNEDEEYDTFSTANVSPQYKGLNRKGWERLEETVRAWKVTRPRLEIYAGPIILPGAETIGDDKIPVPVSFYKIVIDRAANQNIAFLMPQKDIPKRDMWKYQTTVTEIEKQFHHSFPNVPDKNSMLHWDDSDLHGWRVAHRKACQNAKDEDDDE